MSRFYTEIARYYEYIFPVRKAKIELIKELAGKLPADILDVACGPGGYSKILKDAGYNITAVDLDEKMVKNLKEKDNSIDAYVLNMTEIGEMDKKFDLIFCIGNSLVHLADEEEIFTFLQDCRNCLKSGGKLLIQIVNYDRILDGGVKSLPTIVNDEVDLVFERYYEYLPDKHKIDFKTILKVDNREMENHVLLHPIQSKKLLSLLEEVGFLSLKTYGNFNKDEFDPLLSFPLVVTAGK
ncbi:MAG TPA: class I SAM-dependent methyltransferase [Halanaerobiales bacterium]|nr:class I SAM-dependent methyltransferase [Halanaerobiales bacterium]